MIDPAITHPKNAEERRAQGKAVEAAMQEGVRDALIQHKLLGQPIVVWEEG